MTTAPGTRLHATCVAIAGAGALLRGGSGAGKSDLALRLIDRGARLVADDQVLLSGKGGRIIAHPPAPIEGRMEVRGVGIITVPHEPSIPVAALFDLVSTEAVERLPEPRQEMLVASMSLPVWALDPFEPSAPLKLALLMDAAARIQR